MQNVCIITNVYVITVDDLYKGTKFYVRATQAGAENLFKKIVKEIYFFDQGERDMKEELEEAWDLGFWESENGNVVTCTKCTAVAEGENLTVVK